MNTCCLACPVCGDSLEKKENTFRCEKGHSFDISKHGYVNLLPPSGKGVHGDNKEMIRARKEFLDAGHYEKLRSALATKVKFFCETRRVNVLDAGCGEGYYTEAIENALHADITGIDISKDALVYASKRLKNACLAVGSVYRLPILPKKFDVVLNLFAPFDKGEYLRVMKNTGRLYMVIPGEDHLFELKAKLYDVPYKNALSPFEIDGFKLVSKENITYEMNITSGTDLQNLFKMTPYYYRTSPGRKAALDGISSLKITADFIILEYSLQ